MKMILKKIISITNEKLYYFHNIFQDIISITIWVTQMYLALFSNEVVNKADKVRALFEINI